LRPRTSPPFRADHVGSLLRPPEVKAARERFQSGAITGGRLREVEDEAIRSNVAMQREVGLQAVTDGEIRRQSWHMDFIYQLGGIRRVAEGQTVEFHTLGGETIISAQGALRVEGKVSLEHTIFGEDFTTLASMAGSAMAKLTIRSVRSTNASLSAGVARAIQAGLRRPQPTRVRSAPYCRSAWCVSLRRGGCERM
jgi:methionine synthase II (cobalamin-independent)